MPVGASALLVGASGLPRSEIAPTSVSGLARTNVSELARTSVRELAPTSIQLARTSVSALAPIRGREESARPFERSPIPRSEVCCGLVRRVEELEQRLVRRG